MKEMISYCGLACHECPTFLATQTNDDEKRLAVAEMWSKQFGFDLKRQDINCDGCHSDSGRLFGHCKMCEIRKCGMEKKVTNCAHCEDYSCEKLENLVKIIPHAKKNLEHIRSSL